MTIGNTINYSIPAVGTTVDSFARSSTNSFLDATYTAATGSFPATLTIRQAKQIATKKTYGLTCRIKPSDVDDPGTVTKGDCTVSLNIVATPGSIMTKAEISEFIRYTLSAALHANLLEDLYDGITV